MTTVAGDLDCTPRLRRWALSAGVAVLVVAWGSAAIAVLLAAAQGLDWSNAVRLVVTAIVYAPVSAIVFTRRRRAVGAIVGALAATSGLLAVVAVMANSPDASPAIDELFTVVAVIARQSEIAALAILPWLFVRDRRGARSVGVALGIAAIGADVSMVVLAVGAGPVPTTVQLLPLATAIVSFVAAAIALVDQAMRSSSSERQALRWFGAGVVLLVLSYSRVLADVPPLISAITDAAFVLAQALLPTAILALALTGRRVDSDRRYALGIMWVQSIAFAVALYLVVDATARALGLPQAVAGAFAAGALALTFSAVLQFVRRRSALLYFGQGADARSVLGRLGDRLVLSGTHADGVRQLAESLRDTWQLGSVTITPLSGAPEVRIGDAGAYSTTRELTVSGRPIGTLELTSSDEMHLRTTVEPVLHQIGSLIAVAVLLAEVNREVEVTRTRMLGIRRHERRMLYRELHDELAPALAGVGFGMAAALRLVATAAPDAADAVAELRVQVADRAEDIRRLARTMLPAALDAGDLDGALDELARRFAGEGTPVEIHSSGSDVLEPAVQIAVYLAAAEAVSTARQSRAVTRLDVRVEVEPDRVTVHAAAALASGAIEATQTEVSR